MVLFFQGTYCYEPAAENVTVSGYIDARYQNTETIYCVSGHITSSNGPSPINIDNYKTLRISQYDIDCLENGNWSQSLDCTRECDRSQIARDWSLITGRGGGYQTGEGGGGHVKFYPYEKGGGAEKVLAMLKEGGGAQQG